MTLSTVYIVNETTDLVERERRRSNKLSTNVVITRQSFGKEVRKTLSISTFIDNYNHYMRDVDLVNQYRITYEMHKSIRRSWFYILLVLLDISIVNSYRIVPSSVDDSDTYSGSTGTGVGSDWVGVQVRDQGFLS